MVRESHGDAPPQGGQGKNEGEQPIFITPENWAEGMTPRGYQEARRALKDAESKLPLSDLKTLLAKKTPNIDEWENLITKAETGGITEEESREITEMSILITTTLGQLNLKE